MWLNELVQWVAIAAIAAVLLRRTRDHDPGPGLGEGVAAFSQQLQHAMAHDDVVTSMLRASGGVIVWLSDDCPTCDVVTEELTRRVGDRRSLGSIIQVRMADTSVDATVWRDDGSEESDHVPWDRDEGPRLLDPPPFFPALVHIHDGAVADILVGSEIIGFLRNA